MEIISLCFETKDYEKSKKAIIRFRDDIGAKFTFLHAGVAGSKDRTAAFPMLQGPMAFPSAVFIDRHGVIRKVHTGFSGPGTGEYLNNMPAKPKNSLISYWLKNNLSEDINFLLCSSSMLTKHKCLSGMIIKWKFSYLKLIMKILRKNILPFILDIKVFLCKFAN